MSKNKLIKAFVLAAFCLVPLASRSQHAITFAGGDISTPSGSVSFSYGEVATMNVYDSALHIVNVTTSFNQGVQQPVSPVDVYVGIVEALSVEVKVYPNPTTDVVVIECNDATTPLVYTLYSAEGRQLMQGEHQNGATRLDLRSLASGNYMLKVSDSERNETNLYKLIKIK